MITRRDFILRGSYFCVYIQHSNEVAKPHCNYNEVTKPHYNYNGKNIAELIKTGHRNINTGANLLLKTTIN